MTHEPLFFTEKILGFRSWQITGGLRSRLGVIDYKWTTGRNEAECFADRCTDITMPRKPLQLPHTAPDERCNCGFYAWHIPNSQRNTSDTALITGAILAWGRIEAHHLGFRAQYAEVIALAPYMNTVGAGEVAERMGVPLFELPDMLEYAESKGAPLDRKFRPLGKLAAAHVNDVQVHDLLRERWLRHSRRERR